MLFAFPSCHTANETRPAPSSICRGAPCHSLTAGFLVRQLKLRLFQSTGTATFALGLLRFIARARAAALAAEAAAAAAKVRACQPASG